MSAYGLVNRKLGQYLIQDIVGQGSMGIVYRAVDEASGREVALKTIAPATPAAQSAIDRFQREAQCLERCDAPHVATVYGTGRDDGVDYIAMEMMASTLQTRVEAGPLSMVELVGIGAQILMALAVAHRAGIVHRDVKPANIGISRTGMVKLLDFGLAETLPWSASAGQSSTGLCRYAVVGSLPYMPPEQLCGDPVDARADLYATGAVLYELATGRPPFDEASGARLIDAILHRKPLPPSSCNAAIGAVLDRVILRALAKKRASRYLSAAAMMDALLSYGKQAPQRVARETTAYAVALAC